MFIVLIFVENRAGKLEAMLNTYSKSEIQ